MSKNNSFGHALDSLQKALQIAFDNSISKVLDRCKFIQIAFDNDLPD
jgi:hypothetical protein